MAASAAAAAAAAAACVLSAAWPVKRWGAMPAWAAARLNMSTAVGLRSVPVTVQVGLALSSGSRDEPHPHPISKKRCGGWLMVR